MNIDPNDKYCSQLLNTYQNYYKRSFLKAGIYSNNNLLEGIDIENPTSTNRPLENFYEALYKHKEYEQSNPELAELYQFGMPNIPPTVTASSELYGISNNGKIEWISPSLFAVIAEATNMLIECEPQDVPITQNILVVNLK